MATGKILFTAVFSALTLNAAFADNSAENKKEEKKESRLTFGGYGEAAYSRNFFSDNYLRYTDAKNYTGESHGRFDLPHVVFYVGYDFGKGWSLGSEIEIEHGGRRNRRGRSRRIRERNRTRRRSGTRTVLDSEIFLQGVQYQNGTYHSTCGRDKPASYANRILRSLSSGGRKHHHALYMARNRNQSLGTGRKMEIRSHVTART